MRDLCSYFNIFTGKQCTVVLKKDGRQMLDHKIQVHGRDAVAAALLHPPVEPPIGCASFSLDDLIELTPEIQRTLHLCREPGCGRYVLPPSRTNNVGHTTYHQR